MARWHAPPPAVACTHLLQVLRLHREALAEPLPQSLLDSHVSRVQLHYRSAAITQLGSWASLRK